MKNQFASATLQSAPPIAANIWLWVVQHNAAWWVSILTVVYLVSQLFWGWTRFFGGKRT